MGRGAGRGGQWPPSQAPVNTARPIPQPTRPQGDYEYFLSKNEAEADKMAAKEAKAAAIEKARAGGAFRGGGARAPGVGFVGVSLRRPGLRSQGPGRARPAPSPPARSEALAPPS